MPAILLSTGGRGYGNRFPLSESVHLSLECGSDVSPMNHGYGMLFAPGVVLENNTIDERLVRAPSFVQVPSGYAIACQREGLAGAKTDPDRLLLWTTEDFVTFSGPSLARSCDYPDYDPEHPVLRAEISEETARAVARRYLMPSAGEAPLFPLADGYADPVLLFWHGQWLFIATNDNTGSVGLFIRRADTMEGLFAPGFQEHCLLQRSEEQDLIGCFWAPELHEIGGRLCILLAISGRVWGPQSRVMLLREGGDPTRAEDWEGPVRVVRADGSPLASAGITLDMTFVRARSGSYLVWSYREHIFDARDTGSMLLIARIDEREPWRLTSEPVLLSRPLLAWENRGRTINNEGPYPLYSGDDIYLTYSGGAAGGESYVVGYLLASTDDDLTDPSVWRKHPWPVLHTLRVPGVFGPGHNSFFRDEQGDLWIAYHGQLSADDRTRRTGIHRIRFAPDGTPIFDLTQPPEA